MLLTLRRAAAAWRPPGPCSVCRDWSARALCTACTARFVGQHPRCGRCGLRTATPIDACGGCLRSPPPFDRTVVVGDYAFPWDRLIAAFKFHGRADMAGLFAEHLSAAVLAAGDPLPGLVMPVPLAPSRLAERGYNQAWEVARLTALQLGLAADVAALQRPLSAAHQADLDRRERLVNLRSAFMVEPRHRARVEGRRIALVDDVMTTGTTVREAAAALLRAGASGVDVWVLARTPD